MELERALEKLSPKCQEVYQAIVAFKRDNDGCAPTVRELMVTCEISSTSNVIYWLDRLAVARLIMFVPGARNIRVCGGRWALEGECPP